MLVIIKSAPATPEGERAVKLAREMGADICLVQNGVYFAHSGRIDDFKGKVCALEQDMQLRGLAADMNLPGIETVDYGGIVDLMATSDSVFGMF
jgi:sulfur relay protein TusB/DsrH